jgi:hypothetical protein
VSKPCAVPGCDRPHRAGGFCNVHYERKRKGGDPFSPDGTRHGEPMQFLRQVLEMETDDCVIWPFTRNKFGYAYMSRKEGGTGIVSRRICEEKRGPPPSHKYDAAHSCGNGHLGCVNWRHLRWATRVENAADKAGHGTAPRGVLSGRHKLSEADVVAIREAAADGVRHLQIASHFGVTRQAVSAIASRKRWAHI